MKKRERNGIGEMQIANIKKSKNKKLFSFFLFSLIFLQFPYGVSSASAAPVAGTPEEITSRLQQAIDRASEQGNYQHVQALRLELAQHYAGTGSYALAARQYELLLASRPSRNERVSFSIELGKM